MKAFSERRRSSDPAATSDMERSAQNEKLAKELALIAAGDRRAMARLYSATSSTLLAVCLRVLNDRQTAEDILQDVYIIVWTKAVLYDPGKASPLTWLTTIARNKAIDHLRGASLRPMLPLENVNLVPDPTASDDAAAELERSWDRLMRCLHELEPRQASAIRSAYIDGVSYEVLAQREGVPASTLKSWVRRGLIRLKKARSDWE